jgi:Arc/MetJ family transcription regulator
MRESLLFDNVVRGYNTHREVYEMRTNIVLDDQLVAEAMRLSGAHSKREVVDLALRELVARRHQRDILGLVGQDLIDPDYDVRAMRAGMGRDTD